MRDQIRNVRNEFLALLMDTRTPEELEELRISYLGKKGRLNSLMKGMSDLPSQQRAEMGKMFNETKQSILNEFIIQEKKVKEDKSEWFDPTIPVETKNLGSIHLITQAIEDINDIFKQIGFRRARYPEVEWDWYAFGSLNFPQDHPARDEWETYWVDTKPHKRYGPMLLTPHTSSGQVREMQNAGGVPVRMINIAKCYRRQSDTSHTPVFHQFEGLVIDEDISIANLKGTLDYFAKMYFGKDRVTRLRPYDFVFTEPSFEVDISCEICGGTGNLQNGKKCKLCKEGWLEIGGSGMVHPKVLENGGIDPEKYTGFAFGWGVERVLMMRSGINIYDLRTLYSPDIRFLKQF